MPNYSPDYSQEFKPLDQGSYTTKIVDFEEKSSKKDNTPYLQWTLEVVGGDYAGAKVWATTMLAGRGAGILKHFLKCCDGEYAGGEFDPADYVNSNIGVKIEMREFNGKTNPNVTEFFTVEQLPADEDDVDEDSNIPF